MTATCRSPPVGLTTINLPLFLITLTRTAKFQEYFRLQSHCHIVIRVQIHRAQDGLTHWHNYQKFDHVGTNCKQPLRCFWCGGGHLHKECPEKGNTSSTPTCCNCRLAEGENSHLANNRCCSHAKEEMQKNKSQRTPRAKTGGGFSCNLTTPGVSFAATLWGKTEGEQQPETHQVAGLDTMECSIPAPLLQHEQQTTC
jgi:hypothetical protein